MGKTELASEFTLNDAAIEQFAQILGNEGILQAASHAEASHDHSDTHTNDWPG